jgi:hypothetical protein
MARMDRADLIEIADAYGGNAGLVRHLGYQRGATGSQDRREYNAAIRAVQRATAPATATERHAGIKSPVLRQRIAQRVDPVRVAVNTAQRRFRQRHTGPPAGVIVDATFTISNDTRSRAINLPLDDDPELAAAAMARMDTEDLAAFLSDALGETVSADDLESYDLY